jgi:hypothetical protein
MWPRAVNGDVQPRVPQRVIGRAEPAAVAELGPHRGRQQAADSVVALRSAQHPGCRAENRAAARHLRAEPVNLPDPGLDRLSARGAQPGGGQPLLALGRAKLGHHRNALVEQRRVHPLLPAGVLLEHIL